MLPTWTAAAPRRSPRETRPTLSSRWASAGEVNVELPPKRKKMQFQKSQEPASVDAIDSYQISDRCTPSSSRRENNNDFEILWAPEEGTFLGKNDPAGRSIVPACALGAGEEEEEEGEFLDCCKGKGGCAGGSFAAALGTRSNSNQVAGRGGRRDEADVIQTAGVLSWVCL